MNKNDYVDIERYITVILIKGFFYYLSSIKTSSGKLKEKKIQKKEQTSLDFFHRLKSFIDYSV